MTDKNFITTEAPALIGVGAQSIVDRAASLGLTWNLRPATISVAGTIGIQITYDGDSRPINCVNMTGNYLFVGDRVMGMFVPPSGNFVTSILDIDTWHPFVFQNAWTNTGGVRVPCNYRKLATPNGCVQLVGEMTGGTTTNATVVTNLPAAYRPLHDTSFPIAVNPSATTSVVGPIMMLQQSGDLIIFGVTGSFIYMNAIVPLNV